MALDIKTESISTQLLGTQANHGSMFNSNAAVKVDTDSPELISTDVLTLTRLIKSRAESAAMRISSSQKMEAMSAAQVATSAIQDIRSIMVRLGELSEQAANVQSDSKLESIQVEAQRLGQQIYSILNNQSYGNKEYAASFQDDVVARYSSTENTPGSLADLLNSIQQVIDKPLNNMDLTTPEKAAVTESNLTEAVEILDNYANELQTRMSYIDNDTTELSFTMLSNISSNALVSQKQADETADVAHEKIMNSPELASLVHSQLSPAVVASLLS